MLNLTGDSLTTTETLRFGALTIDLVISMTEPTILTGVKTHFKDLVAGSEAFYNNAKKQAAEAKKPIGRVIDGFNEDQLKVCTDAVTQIFKTADDELSNQIVVGPLLPDSLATNTDVAAAFQPAFWCAGANHEATHHEAHMFGSVRACFMGSRNFACADFAKFTAFIHAKAQGVSDGKDKAGAGWSSLASVNSSITSATIRKRFRNLTSDLLVVSS